MRSKIAVMLAFAGLISGVLIVFAQEPGDDVRGAFMSSRPKTTNTNAPRRPRPHNTNTNTKTTNSNASSGFTKNANTNTALTNANTSRNKNWNNSAQAIGLGYTLFMRGPDGGGMRVEPARAFHNGDRVRISLEPNIDGYLYVFHTENDGPPEMIYPDPRLDQGDNSIQAHVPLDVPSSEESDERLRWFTFYGNGGTEHLYVVVTREPLNSAPAGDELVTLCATAKDKCPWHPSAEVWSRIMRDTQRSTIRVVTAKQFGQPQTDSEKVATTRGLGLDQSAPEPSVIRINASTTDPMLVTVLDLIHK